MSECLQVVTTVPDQETASRLAQLLVDQRLAACAQVLGPIRSVYRWQGNVEQAQEWLCLIKTTREAYPALEAAIRTHHPYEVAEIIATPIVEGNAAYLEWIRKEVGLSAGTLEQD